MGFFNNIIADSRLPVRSASPFDGLWGFQPNPTAPMDVTVSALTGEPLVQRRPAKASISSHTSVTDTMASNAIAKDGTTSNAAASVEPVPTQVSLQPKRLAASEEPNVGLISDTEVGKDFPAAQTLSSLQAVINPRHSKAIHQDTASSPAPKQVQDKTSIPTIRSENDNPVPPSDVTNGEVSFVQAPSRNDCETITTGQAPHGNNSASDVTQSGRPSALSMLAAQKSVKVNVTTNEMDGSSSVVTTAPARQLRPAQVSAANVPQVPAQSIGAVRSERSRAASHAPQVRIGQVNVVVETSAVVPRPRHTSSEPADLSSRLFLRSL